MRHKLAALLPGMRDARHVFRHFTGSLAACQWGTRLSQSDIRKLVDNDRSSVEWLARIRFTTALLYITFDAVQRHRRDAG